MHRKIQTLHLVHLECAFQTFQCRFEILRKMEMHKIQIPVYFKCYDPLTWSISLIGWLSDWPDPQGTGFGQHTKIRIFKHRLRISICRGVFFVWQTTVMSIAKCVGGDSTLGSSCKLKKDIFLPKWARLERNTKILNICYMYTIGSILYSQTFWFIINYHVQNFVIRLMPNVLMWNVFF